MLYTGRKPVAADDPHERKTSVIPAVEATSPATENPKEDHQNDQQISQLAPARKVMITAAIAGSFLLSATLALVVNNQGNSGEREAEAARPGQPTGG